MIYNNIRDYAPAVVRIGVSIVFLWFGLNQIFDSGSWIGFLPDFVSNFPFTKNFLVQIHGSVEVILALFLISGIFVRIPALLLSIQLLVITINMGYNAIAVRDFGLTVATFSIFLYGKDKLCLRKKSKENRFWKD